MRIRTHVEGSETRSSGVKGRVVIIGKLRQFSRQLLLRFCTLRNDDGPAWR